LRCLTYFCFWNVFRTARSDDLRLCLLAYDVIICTRLSCMCIWCFSYELVCTRLLDPGKWYCLHD
ncbi:Os11g0668700, partial [Oryza sativa Japonica Group]